MNTLIYSRKLKNVTVEAAMEELATKRLLESAKYTLRGEMKKTVALKTVLTSLQVRA